jgi:hypothetical protein
MNQIILVFGILITMSSITIILFEILNEFIKRGE